VSHRNHLPRFYFSLRSPYSWLAYRDLFDRYPTLAAELEWKPFWEPDEQTRKLLADRGGDFLYTPMSKAKHLYTLQDVRRLATDRGLKITWPVDREPWWEVPHLAYLVAREHGQGQEFIAAASRARWEEGRDICDPVTIAGIATGLGLDEAGLTGAAGDPDVRAKGAKALLEVYRDGVFGVPFFVNGFAKFWGVDRLAAFAGSVRPGVVHAGAAPGPAGSGEAATVDAAATVAMAVVDDGHVGGCG